MERLKWLSHDSYTKLHLRRKKKWLPILFLSSPRVMSDLDATFYFDSTLTCYVKGFSNVRWRLLDKNSFIQFLLNKLHSVCLDIFTKRQKISRIFFFSFNKQYGDSGVTRSKHDTETVLNLFFSFPSRGACVYVTCKLQNNLIVRTPHAPICYEKKI